MTEQEKRFKRFNDAWQVWRAAGCANSTPEAAVADRVLNALKPYIDQHWDAYQEWKAARGIV